MAFNFRPSQVSDSFPNPFPNITTPYDKVPFYYDQSDEIDWSRPRHSWNINQKYTYFSLFGYVASENFKINQLLGNPKDQFVNEYLFFEVDGDTYNCAKSVDKICVVCEKDEHKEKIASLDCGHGHHVYCMENWMQQWNVCPFCKFDAIKY